jgi:hypothetical protein
MPYLILFDYYLVYNKITKFKANKTIVKICFAYPAILKIDLYFFNKKESFRLKLEFHFCLVGKNYSI